MSEKNRTIFPLDWTITNPVVFFPREKEKEKSQALALFDCIGHFTRKAHKHNNKNHNTSSSSSSSKIFYQFHFKSRKKRRSQTIKMTSNMYRVGGKHKVHLHIRCSMNRGHLNDYENCFHSLIDQVFFLAFICGFF